MQKPRRVNTIKALKKELEYYKRQPIPIGVVDRTGLKHLKLSSVFKSYELQCIPEDKISDMVLHRMASVFKDHIESFPIETSYDTERDVFMVELDIWVKEE